MKWSGIVAVAATAALAGCGSAVIGTIDGSAVPQRAAVQSHMLAGTLGADGKIGTVTDRTASGVATDVTVNVGKVPFSDTEVPSSTEVAFKGTMTGGTTIPDSGRMLADRQLVDDALAGRPIDQDAIKYGNGDAMLQVVGTGNGFVAGRYTNKAGGTGFLGYVVAGERTKSMPTAGLATFVGKANATVVGSSSGTQNATGNVTLTAAFAAGGGTVGGTITGLTAGAGSPTYNLALAPAAISGNSYGNGSITSASGGVVTSSNYQGGFYNAGATGTAGTFYLQGTGMGGQSVEMVGAFGGNR